MNPPPPSQPYSSSIAGEPEAAAPPAARSRSSELDLALVRRMHGGDERALGEFYDRWYPIVSALVTRMLKSADDVEDVVEECFWQAWRQAGRFVEDRGTVQTWLLTIARSRSLDRLRAAKRRHEESIEDVNAGPRGIAADAFVSTANDPSYDVEHNERRTLILQALAELPAEQRQALELGYFGGLSQSEIAERTGQPLGTVKTRMRLAMLKLRDRLSLLREEAR
jgi:RNA polymerase sigma-70 factor, ECF subfamily